MQTVGVEPQLASVAVYQAGTAHRAGDAGWRGGK